MLTKVSDNPRESNTRVSYGDPTYRYTIVRDADQGIFCMDNGMHDPYNPPQPMDHAESHFQDLCYIRQVVENALLP